MFGKLISAFNNWWNDGANPAPPAPVLRSESQSVTPAAAPSPLSPAARRAAAAQAAPEVVVRPMPDTVVNDGEADPFLVHREVLDERLAVQGVEFFVRGELRDKVQSTRSATRRFLDGMLVDQLASLRRVPMHQRQAWVQLSEVSLMRLGTGKLPAGAAVLLLAENASQPASADLREAIGAMQDAGHEVWLDDALGTPWFVSLEALANGATLRLALRTPYEVDELFKEVRQSQPAIKLGAWDVNTEEDFEMAKRLGCRRFSGAFVTKRDNWDGRELAPQMLTVASLVNQIKEETNLREVASVLKQDMAMSYRLLRYVNSAAHGLTQQISSIEQGLLVMGQAQLDRWLTLLLLSGGAMGDTALTEIALTRARFLEIIGAYRLPPEQCEKLFVLGLFSMLDVALKVPLETAIKPLRLTEQLSAALLRREGPYGMYLKLADACQSGVASEITKYALMLGLTSNKVSAKQVEAINWVAEISAKPAQRTTQ